MDKDATPPKYATYLTNSLSAVWHGFYPGYYLAFVLAAFTVDQSRRMRARFRPLIVDTNSQLKYFYHFFAHLFTHFIFNYGLAAFVGLSLERSFTFYKHLYYCAYILIILDFIFLTILDFIAPLKRKKI